MACLRPIAPDDGFAGRTPWDRSALAAADHIKEYANIMPYFVCARWPVPRRLYSLERELASTAWLGIIRPPGRSALPWHCLCSKEVEDDEDDIAERAVRFGGVAVGTARMVARRSSLAEHSACHHTR